jgi:hypothetical protein
MDQELSELAGELKVRRKMSLADFACPGEETKDWGMYDNPEFKALEQEIKVG